MRITKELIEEIGDQLDLGMKCFINTGTNEIVTFPDQNRFHDDTEAWDEEIAKVDNEPEKFKEIIGMSSTDSFRIMEAFTDSIDNNKIQSKLIQALEGHKPFANFKLQVDNSGEYRQMWFAFKKDAMIKFVNDQLNNEKP